VTEGVTEERNDGQDGRVGRVGRVGPDARPTVSVVVPVYNDRGVLEDQLRALVDQECSEEWEVVLADNGSTDGSVELARAWGRQYPFVRWTDASAVAGPAAARTPALRVAQGGLVAFCDADDVVRPGWLASLVGTLGQADVAAGFFDFGSLNGGGASPPVPPSLDQLPFLPAGLGANLAVRRLAFDAVGGFAEELLTGEDIDFCWRLQVAGYRLAHSPGAVVDKRDRTGFRPVFRQGFAFGRGGAVLYRRHRASGARRNFAGAARSWLWLLVRSPQLATPGRGRDAWARTAGMRIGRLVGSVRGAVFFP
jgi:glycosyltransferase involved in cell wall biosynthesis